MTVERGSIIDSNMHICGRCGEKYDYTEIEPPENATFYWVPPCPACGADMTATTVTKTWMDIIGSGLEKDAERNYDYSYERQRMRVHFHARLYHGRLAGLSVEELIERAQWFDSRVSHGRRVGPEFERDVAFAVRRQARNMIIDDK